MKVMWFSGGVSSAIALKLTKNIDKVFYIHIDDQHDDTLRFVNDVSKFTGHKIEIIQSPLKNVENACFSAGGKGYINGVAGASCTYRLKRLVRIEWEKQLGNIPLTYVWGIDYNEKHRATRIEESMPMVLHEFPLIDRKLTKQDTHGMLKKEGIKRPVMYDLGYPNNNCIGCVKGGMGYWNKIRIDFPEVFKQRMEMEEKIGASCGKIRLKDLDPERGRNLKPIVEDCGIMCELNIS